METAQPGAFGILRAPATRGYDLLLAVPVAAFVPALVILLVSVVGTRASMSDYLYAPLAALFFSAYLLPFAIFAAVPCYFAYRSFGQLGWLQCTVTGLVVGGAVAAGTESMAPTTLAFMGGVGATSGFSAWGVLALLAKRRRRVALAGG